MKTKLNKANLPLQYAGVDGDLSQMGTTGLIAWMLSGKDSGKNRWQRYQAVRRVVLKRYGSRRALAAFCKGIVSTAALYRINTNRFVQAVQADLAHAL